MSQFPEKPQPHWDFLIFLVLFSGTSNYIWLFKGSLPFPPAADFHIPQTEVKSADIYMKPRVNLPESRDNSIDKVSEPK